jgi:hypothetical protein
MFADWPDGRDQAHPCRPTVSCTADIAAPGTLEIEVGEQYARSSAVGAPSELSFPVLLKQSIAKIVQIQAGSNGYTAIDTTPIARYLDNVYFGPKLHVHDQETVWPSLSLSAELSVPTFVATGYARGDDVFVTAYASKDVAFLHFDWNVGALLWHVDDAATTQAFTALAVSPALPSPWGAAVEGYVFSDASPWATRDGGVRLAASYAARPWLVLDVGGDAGIFPSTHAYALFTGFTVIPVVLR